MSVHAAPLDHRAYVLFAVLTHALVGYALAALARREPTGAVVGAVFPDVDLLFPPEWTIPFVHRGLTHTPLFALGVVALAWTRRRPTSSDRPARWSAATVALGYGSHLVLDSFTRSGVPWLYPVTSTSYGVDAAVHAVDHALVVWAVALAVLWYRRIGNPCDVDE